MKILKKAVCLLSAAAIAAAPLTLAGCADSRKEIVLRVSSWEEYIDLGGWEEDEVIELESGNIFGENSMVDDFTEWFNANHDYKVRVEYSTFGTNEDLYNRLSLGDEYDLVCPSDYLLMKLIAEDKYVEYSDEFWDTGREENYYAKFVSSFIDGAEDSMFNNISFATKENPDENLHKKAACFMWGTLGFAYNPELIPAEDISTWRVLTNSDYARQVTIKDNVRDAYFATLGIIKGDKMSADLSSAQMSAIMNDVSAETLSAAQSTLKDIRDNVYSFETDSGKADMITGKVIANEQWSGDAVLIMDEAEDEGAELWYSIPDECTNIWFDGWLMLKSGIGGDEKRQEAAEAFVNFLSRPDNAVRNMYYIGYTSAIAGDTVFEYMNWNYGSEEEEDVFEYDLSYFFGDGYAIVADKSEFDLSGGSISRGRQLFAQYPPVDIVNRGVVMHDFGGSLADVNRMWINVRCMDITEIPIAAVVMVAAVILLAVAAILLYKFRYTLFIRHRPKKGYEKV